MNQISEDQLNKQLLDFGEGTSCRSFNSKFIENSINSFSDDLMENILQYLSFEDKVLLESVSKQWRRTIYNRQTKLHLNSNNEDIDNLINLLKPILVNDYPSGCAHSYGYKAIKTDSFKSILNKCKSIKTIQFDCYCDGFDLNLIGKYCNHLESIELNLFGLCEQTLHEFSVKYGHKLKVLKVNNSIYCLKVVENLFNSCMNLIEFHSDDNLNFIKEDEKYLPKLQTIGSLNINIENYQKVGIIADKYGKTLKKLELFLNINNETLATLLYITCLKSLKFLRIDFSMAYENETTIDELLLEIGKSCNNIRELILFIYDNSLISERFLFTFENFYSLKRLNLNLINIDKTLEGSVECFRNINLKEFSITYEELSDQFFNDIHIYLPNVESIEIVSNKDISDKTIISLSKLKYLKNINFPQRRSAFSEITDFSICQLLELCSDIEVMTFSSRPNITHKTIDKLIETALKYPNKKINFFCGFSGEENEQQFANIQINDYIHLLPQNLEINIILADLND